MYTFMYLYAATEHSPLTLNLSLKKKLVCVPFESESLQRVKSKPFDYACCKESDSAFVKH